MFRKAFNLIPLVVSIFLSVNCSFLMVNDELERQSKIKQNHIGWTQEECEKYWGSPLATAEHADGSKTCVYEFKRVSYYPYSIMSKNFWLLADGCTLGFAEFLSVPMIMVNKYYTESNYPKTRAWITYDLDNRVKQEKCITEIE